MENASTTAAEAASGLAGGRSEREAEFFRQQRAAKDEMAKEESDAVAAMDPEERARHAESQKAAKEHAVEKDCMLREQVAKGGYGSKAAKSALAGRGRGRSGKRRGGSHKIPRGQNVP